MATIDYGQGPVTVTPDFTGRASGTGFNLPTAPTIPAPTYAGPTPAQQAANSNPHPNGIAGATGPTASAPYGVDPSGNPYPSSAAASGERSAGSIYGGTGNSDLDAALAAAGESYKKAAFAPDPSDPAVQAQIRAATLASFQAEIDATNSMYANKLAEAKRVGTGRLGSSTAVQARSGLLGSDFGAAQTDNVNTGNESIYSGIQEEQNAKIQAILTQSSDVASKAISEATAARAAGLDNYVKFLQSANDRKNTNANAAAAAVLQAGIDPTTLTPDQLNQYLTNYGISKEDLTKAYTAAKPGFDTAKAKAAADALAAADAHNTAKAGLDKTVAPGSTVIGPDGKPIYTAPKDASGGNVVPPQQQKVLEEFGKSLTDPKIFAAVNDGSMTREDLIRLLQGQYGGTGANQINRDDIAKKVYETYADKPQEKGGFFSGLHF